ncbi:MAG TPA: RnfH family protein [Burkholderiales bacterium]|nr:RnfH family protein [Burkholderiales bacterium]
MNEKTRLHVEVVYALRDEQVLVALEVEQGTTVREAVERSGLPERFPGLQIAPGRVGVFGRVVPLEFRLRDGDRVEIYRPLLADPKQARREKAVPPGAGPRRSR